MTTPIPHGARVRLISLPTRGGITWDHSTLSVGQEGTVMTMRGYGSRAEYLVKWVGKSGPVSVMWHNIEEVK